LVGFSVYNVYNANEFKAISEAEFLNEIQTKVFLLAIHSHPYSFALRFLFLQTHATSNSFYCSGGKEENLIKNHTPFPTVYEIYTEISSLRTLKIMP
jgi:hypothetical protein